MASKRTVTHYWIDGVRYTSRNPGAGWQIHQDQTGEYITTVIAEGSRYVSTAYPGKKWGSIRQALQYVLTMRHG